MTTAATPASVASAAATVATATALLLLLKEGVDIRIKRGDEETVALFIFSKEGDINAAHGL